MHGMFLGFKSHPSHLPVAFSKVILPFCFLRQGLLMLCLSFHTSMHQMWDTDNFLLSLCVCVHDFMYPHRIYIKQMRENIPLSETVLIHSVIDYLLNPLSCKRTASFHVITGKN